MKTLKSSVDMRKVIVLILASICIVTSCSDESTPQVPLVISDISPLSGPKTTIVTIIGSGFSANEADNIVTLNDIGCPVTFASTTELKVTIPAKGGSGKLVVNVNGKTGETPQFTYIYSEAKVTTLAGSTAGDGDKFTNPKGIAIDKDGNVYVADHGNHKIKKVTPSGVVSTLCRQSRLAMATSLMVLWELLSMMTAIFT